MQESIQKSNEYPNSCNYFYSAFLQQGILANSGYNCKHQNQLEVVEIDGQKIGCCYPWSCPLVPVKP